MTDHNWRERLDSKLRFDPPPPDRPVISDCWTWTSYLMPNGYSLFWYQGRKEYTHRFTYRMFVGPIADGMTVDHLCRNRACCNPDHLEMVTQRENTLRSGGPAAAKAAQTHCIHGHPFDATNTYLAPNGTRKCRICRNRAKRDSYHRLKT